MAPRFREERGEMKRFLLGLAMLAVAGVLVPASAAAPVAVASGGGNGTFNGTTAGSHFGFGVHYGTGASGQFQCNMAGNSAFDGLREMGLEGTVSSGAVIFSFTTRISCSKMRRKMATAQA